MDTPVFLEKVRRPDARGLPRRRLEERLTGPGAPPTGLVVAPPGSGKTTLLSWVAAHADVPCAWYRADAEDHDERDLVRHLAHAAEAALTDADGRRPSTLRPGWAGAVTGLPALLGVLQQTGPLLIVLDDVHEVAGRPAEQALERLVGLRPRHVRLLLGSRRPPAVNVSRLLVSGDLVQLDAEDLRFRSWETEELFRSVYREPLAPETAAALTRRTGGWAAGLQLFHLGSGGLGRVERERAIAELSGRSRLIRSYLTRNALSGLPAERRRFLLWTSTLGVLTGQACDELLGTTGSAAVLDELEQQHFFTSSIDDGQTFRYHQVLQTHLEVVLADELGEAGVRALYARSADLLERSGRASAAVRAYARAADWAAVSRLLPTSPGAPLGDDALAGMAADDDDPGLLVARARRLLADGRLAEAVDAFRRAEAAVDDLEFRQRCAADRRLATTLLARPQRLDTTAVGPALRTADELRRATVDLRDREACTTGLGRAVSGLLAGDLNACRAGLLVVLHEPPSAVSAVAADLLTELVDALAARRPPSLGVLDQVVAAADQAGLPWFARLARGLSAATLLLLDPSEDHLAACVEMLDHGDLHGDAWSRVLLASAVGAAARLSGSEQAGTAALRRAAAAAAGLDAPVLAVWVDLLLGPSAPPAADERGRRARVLGVTVPDRLGDGLPSAPRIGTAAASAPTPSRVRLLSLGRFAIEVDGDEVAWSSLRPRARSLLMMLAVQHGRPVHRERLVDALWPEVSLGAGIRSLQVAVSSIRQCLGAAGLGEAALSRDGAAYVLRLPGCDDQRAQFEDLAQQSDRAVARGEESAALALRSAALERYAGDLVPEAGPAEWVLAERERLAAVAVRVAVDTAALGLRLDDVPAALAAARRAVEVDGYCGLGWELLGTAHERSGDLTAAAAVRREHARVAAELGLGRDEPPGVEPRVIRPRRTSREARAPA